MHCETEISVSPPISEEGTHDTRCENLTLPMLLLPP